MVLLREIILKFDVKYLKNTYERVYSLVKLQAAGMQLYYI